MRFFWRDSEGIAVASPKRRTLQSFFLWPLAVIGLIYAVSQLVVWLSPFDPERTIEGSQLLPPSAKHLFGTDSYGMDIFTRIFAAIENDIFLPVAGVSTALVIGTITGVYAGFKGRYVDTFASRFTEGLQAIPLFLLGLTIVAALGNGATVLIILIAIVNIPIFFRLARSTTLPLSNADFVLAARGAGLPDFRIITKHLVPNIMVPIVAQSPISCGYGIQVVAGLSFLGIGIPIPSAEWGLMIKDGASILVYGNWWVSFFPGLAILITVIFFHVLGRRISRDYQRWIAGRS
jgi:peptide/nickel transport system permease protein